VANAKRALEGLVYKAATGESHRKTSLAKDKLTNKTDETGEDKILHKRPQTQ
jgi:hypothetical protein